MPLFGNCKSLADLLKSVLFIIISFPPRDYATTTTSPPTEIKQFKKTKKKKKLSIYLVCVRT